MSQNEPPNAAVPDPAEERSPARRSLNFGAVFMAGGRAAAALWATIVVGFSTRYGKATLAAAALAALFLGLTALEAYAPAPPENITRAIGQPEDALLARIGERHIFLSDLELLARAKRSIGADERLDPRSAEARRLLEEAIDQHLLARRALELGLQDEVDVRVRLRAAQERILASAFLEREVAERVAPETVYSIYESQNALLELGDEIQARQIIVATRNAAQDARALLRGGADFAALAREISLDRNTAARGGDLGFFTAETMAARSPETARAAFAAAVGDIVGPFETPEGWRLLKIEARRPVAKPGFEEVRGDIEYFLTLQSVRDIIDELRRGVDVEVYEQGFDIAPYAPDAQTAAAAARQAPVIAEEGPAAPVETVDIEDAPEPEPEPEP